ncbi:ABC transporter permease [Paenibacillus koleovorans]|uniref:ABC transporter permease n=1 Tax=Paenibacillus koleovorans TaxID=121608 RepID=UPI000FDCDBFF|nr:ABC transporter permease subunit [Paenibacillus koleovorans]
MALQSAEAPGQQVPPVYRKKKVSLLARLWKERFIHMLVLPGLLYFIIYRYIPMGGLVIGFQDYSVFKGFLSSDWVGLKHFKELFSDKEVVRVILNTLYLSFLMLAVAFPVPIVLAIMLNEVKFEPFKRTMQSVLYLPHFFSWVIVVSLVTLFLKGEGILNNMLGDWFGIAPIQFLIKPDLFMPLIVAEAIWKESGWGTIIYLAAIAGINPELYEAAIVDGAGRWRKIWNVTLPGMRPTIVILMILALGNVLDSGFEQIFLNLNAFTKQAGNVLDTYVYFKGIQDAQFSFAAAVGMFKSVVGFVLIIAANKFAKRMGGEGLF